MRWEGVEIKIYLTMNIQNNQRKPFKNPSIAMKHGVFSNIPEKTNFSEKDELFLKYAQKTIFPQKSYKFVDFGFGWYRENLWNFEIETDLGVVWDSGVCQ